MHSGPPVLQVFLLDRRSRRLDRLRTELPPHRITPLGLEIELGEFEPEEILAVFLRHGVTARATRLVSPGVQDSSFSQPGFGSGT